MEIEERRYGAWNEEKQWIGILDSYECNIVDTDPPIVIVTLRYFADESGQRIATQDLLVTTQSLTGVIDDILSLLRRCGLA